MLWKAQERRRKSKPAATCLSILQSQLTLRRRSGRRERGHGENHYDNPLDPQNSALQRWRGIPLREWETTSCSHLHLIRMNCLLTTNTQNLIRPRPPHMLPVWYLLLLFISFYTMGHYSLNQTTVQAASCFKL